MGIFAMSKNNFCKSYWKCCLILSRQQTPSRALCLIHICHMEVIPVLIIPEEIMVEKYTCSTLKNIRY